MVPLTSAVLELEISALAAVDVFLLRFDPGGTGRADGSELAGPPKKRPQR